MLPVGDFAWYDQVLTHSLTFGVIPERFRAHGEAGPTLHTLFGMARGVSDDSCCGGAHAQEMTKWFDTNYHYLVPEFSADQQFQLSWEQLFEEVDEARTLGHQVKPVLIGPLTYLWLGKAKGAEFDRLDLLDRLLPLYGQIFRRLAGQGVEWVQIDEPILVLDLPQAWKNAFERAYNLLQSEPLKKLVATYFGGLEDNLGLAANLPVDGLHIDLVRAPEQYPSILDRLPAYKVVSLGLVNGRNVWRCDLEKALEVVRHARERLGERLWVAPSCSLLHSPVDLEREDGLDAELKSWLAFAVQKCREVAVLARAATEPEAAEVLAALEESRAVQASRASSPRIHKPAVQARLAAIKASDAQRRSPFAERIARQRAGLDLPAFPTTTIGSFPQTSSIRLARQSFKQGKLSEAEYIEAMHSEIRHAVQIQEQLGLDVLVHGEAERNDMVEYFAEQLDGYVFTRFGWVQSYGSRCVKPAVIYGDLSRPRAMTVEWIRYAQSLTDKVMKGMLTGPVTMLMWSFPREDVSREVQARQLALAIRDEVVDLEAAGIRIVQIDEAAFREGLPLRRNAWPHYLEGHRGLPPVRLRSPRRNPDPYAHVLQRVQRCDRVHRRHGRRRDHHRDLAFGHGAAGGLRAVRLPERDRSGRLRHPLATRAEPGRDRRVAQGSPADTRRAALGQPGLRPEDPRLAGNRGSAGEHGRRRPRTAWRPRPRLTGGPGERNGTPGVPLRICTSVQRGASTSARSTWSSQTPAIFR